MIPISDSQDIWSRLPCNAEREASSSLNFKDITDSWTEKYPGLKFLKQEWHVTGVSAPESPPLQAHGRQW